MTRAWSRHRPYEKEYKQQRGNAERRGIKFLLTYEEWLKIWTDSGKLKQRGRGAGKYCMARKGDEGPYKIENVYITKNERNCRPTYVPTHTEEFKAALAKRNRKRIWNKNMRAKVGAKSSRRKHSVETKHIIGQASKNFWANPNKRANMIKSRRRARFLRTGFY